MLYKKYLWHAINEHVLRFDLYLTVSNQVFHQPSKKKKSNKGRTKKSVVKASAAANDKQTVEQKALDSQMKRLQIGIKNDDDALLEEAMKLAAFEQKEFEEEQRKNCKHGYTPSPLMSALLRG